MPFFLAAHVANAPECEPRIAAALKEATAGGCRTLQTHRTPEVVLAVDGDDRHDASILAISPSGNALVFAGYVYNLDDKGLGQGGPDRTAQRLLAAFERQGLSAFAGLNGHFAAAVWEAERKTLHVLRDALGIHPAFLLRDSGVTLACAEFQPLLEFRAGLAELCQDAVAEYLLVGTVLGPKTFVQGIESLDAGAALSVGGSSTEVHVIDRLADYEPDASLSPDDHAEAVNVAFTEGVLKRLSHLGDKIGQINLTGGLDTRLILSSIPADIRAVLTFSTTRNPHLPTGEDLEVVYARLVAARFGVDHSVKDPDNFLDGEDFAPNAFEATRRLPSAIIRNFHGVYGTELLGGCFRSAFPSVLPWEGTVEQTLERHFTPDFLATLGPLDDLAAYHARSADLSLGDMLPPLLGGFFTTLYGGMLGGWAAPWEKFLLSEQYPFLDRDVIAALRSVPPQLLENYDLYARIFLNHHQAAADLPFHSGACRHPHLMIVQPRHADPRAKARRYARHIEHLRREGAHPLDGILSDPSLTAFMVRDTGQPLTNTQLNLLDLAAWIARYAERTVSLPATF